MAMDIKVSLNISQTADIVKNAFTQSGLTTELVDYYESNSSNCGIRVMVFEKFFMRNNSRATLTVTVDNLKGCTHVHAKGSGGGQSAFFGFDWGAKENMENIIYNALSRYEI